MGVRYIGSKARVADDILSLAGVPARGRFVDAFSGTGSVAAAAAQRGWAVAVNDSLASAVSMSVGAVVGEGNVSFTPLSGYSGAIDQLNGVEPTPGFLHREYSPASAQHTGIERRYFTEKNAAKLDAMRRLVSEWVEAGMVTETEEHLLLADLMQAANAAANISGTYGCFLRNWTPASIKPVTVKARALPRRATDFIATVGDVFDLAAASADTVYFDPPYTKRQYSAYYHVLETLHAGDAPQVSGITGLRPWKSKASDFCYKSRALDALTRLVATTSASRILLSYSSEGHVDQKRLVNALTEVGAVSVHPVAEIGRYRPNAQASAAGHSVSEYVIEIRPLTLEQSEVATPSLISAVA